MFSPFSMRGFHLAMLYPFPQFILALFIINLSKILYNAGKNNKIKIILVSLTIFIFLTPVITRSILIFSKYYKIYELTGGECHWSNYTKDLLEYINENNITSNQIYSISWGIDTALLFHSLGTFNIEEEILISYGKSDYEKFKKQIDRILHNDKTAYFIYTVWKEKSEAFVLFNYYVTQPNIEMQEIKTIYNKIDDPIYKIYKLTRT